GKSNAHLIVVQIRTRGDLLLRVQIPDFRNPFFLIRIATRRYSLAISREDGARPLRAVGVLDLASNRAYFRVVKDQITSVVDGHQRSPVWRERHMAGAVRLRPVVMQLLPSARVHQGNSIPGAEGNGEELAIR